MKKTSFFHLTPNSLKPKATKGFSLIELMVCVLIISIGLIGVLSLVMQNIQAQSINKNALIASQLAQEGIELVRNVRDSNWLITDNDWDEDIVSDGSYAIDYRGRDYIINTSESVGEKLYINTNGYYTHDSVGNSSTIFSRLISVNKVEITSTSTYLDIKSTVQWKERGSDHNYVAEVYLYDWK